jgi:uncharacterized membrane protein HdeD (DUF308 family)
MWPRGGAHCVEVGHTNPEPEGEEERMLVDSEMGRHWWAFALRGLAAILFGIMAFAWPGPTLAALVLLWGAYALVDGVLAVISAARTGQDHRWGLLLEGVADPPVGLLRVTDYRCR